MTRQRTSSATGSANHTEVAMARVSIGPAGGPLGALYGGRTPSLGDAPQSADRTDLEVASPNSDQTRMARRRRALLVPVLLQRSSVHEGRPDAMSEATFTAAHIWPLQNWW